MRRIIKILTVFVALTLVDSVSASENREAKIAAALVYLEVSDFDALWDSMVIEFAATLPDVERAKYLSSSQVEINVAKVEEIAIDGLLKIYTLEEIEALASFYGSEVGQSILKKSGRFMAYVTPILEELAREEAVERAEEN